MTKNCIEHYVEAWNTKKSIEIFRIITRETAINLGAFLTFYKTVEISYFIKQMNELLNNQIIIENYECLNSNNILLNCRCVNNNSVDIICKTNTNGGLSLIQLYEI